jgi:hypothetical protein
MPLYTATKTKTALVVNQDALTIVAGATKPLRIMVVDVKGMGTASADNEVVLQRSTGGTTAGGALTPQAAHPGSAAAAFAVYTTWSVQPSLSGAPLWRFGANANGGQDKYTALPGCEFPVRVGEQVSLRSLSGTSSVVINLLIEEIDG